MPNVRRNYKKMTPELILIIGTSSAGKTTLAKSVAQRRGNANRALAGQEGTRTTLFGSDVNAVVRQHT